MRWSRNWCHMQERVFSTLLSNLSASRTRRLWRSPRARMRIWRRELWEQERYRSRCHAIAHGSSARTWYKFRSVMGPGFISKSLKAANRLVMADWQCHRHGSFNYGRLFVDSSLGHVKDESNMTLTGFNESLLTAMI